MADREPGQDDRYRPLRQLGEGGAGRVWLVEDRLRPGVRIALKELAEASRGQEESLRREFATLAGLRHPNLVEVHDLDVSPETGLPRFTLEYVEGEDLVATVASEGPEALPGLAAEVLRALAFLHDFGLIHRDLKPGNLLVRRTPRLGCRVVVLDFGLALRGGAADEIPETDGKTAEASTGAAGTLPYLAPELFEGERADRRSDLYALGAVLYEAVHGRTPYTLDGRDLMAFIAAVREGRRARPALPDGYPPGLAGFLEELLSADPAARPGDALEVLARLNAACGTKLAPEIPATRAARLGSGVPVGRDEELKTLWDHLDPVEGPRVVWLCGGAGAGKTRVLRWLAGEAVVRGWEVESPPVGLPLREESAKGEEDALSTYLGELRNRAAKGPTLLLLDEVESATGRVATLLERVGREGKAPPLRVVAALRPAELRQPVVRKLLGDTGIVPTLRRVELEPFGSDGVRAMAARATGTGTVTEPRVEWLLDASEGNPLVVESLLVEGVWEKGGRARRSATIAESIAGRLELLSEHGRQWIEALSVFGEPTSAEIIASLGHLDDGVAKEAESEVAAAGLAREIDGSWMVESRAVTEQIKRVLETKTLRNLHRSAAEFVAGVERKERTPNFGQLARLWSGAGETEQAIEYAVRAAREARRRNDHAEAADSFRFALTHVGRHDARRRELRLEQAGALLQAGSVPAAARASGAAVRLASGNSQRFEALLLQTRCLLQMVSLRRAIASAEEARALAESEHDELGQINSLTLLATSLARAGEEARALPIFEEVLSRAKKQGELLAEATALHYIGACRSSLRNDRAEEYLSQAIELYRQAGHPERIPKCIVSLAVANSRGGKHDLAWERTNEALSMAVDESDAETYKWALTSRAFTAGILGRTDDAIKYTREAEDHMLHMGDFSLALSQRIGRADALILVGRPTEAAELLKATLSGPRERFTPLDTAFALMTLAEADMAGPNPDEDQIRINLHNAIQECRRLGRHTALIAGLLIELERLARPHIQEPMEPVVSEFESTARMIEGGAEPRMLARACLARASRALHSGDYVSALELAQKARSVSAEGRLPELCTRSLILESDVLDKLGRSEEARSSSEQARKTLQQAADRIKDPEVRRDLLNRSDFRKLRTKDENLVDSSNRRLVALYEMIRALNSETDPEILLESILDMALDVVGADRGIILLREPRSDAFRVRVARNVEEETERDALSFSHSIVAQAGEGQSIRAVDAGNDERFRDLRSVSLFKIRSLMCVPLRLRGTIIGTVYLDSRSKGKVFKDDDLQFVEAFADHAALALENARERARLEKENRRLLAVAEERVRYENIVGRSSVMQKVFDMIEKVAESELPVLIQGESGTGKELVARAVHFHGPRKTKLILSENCAAIPESLLESALFGHVRGAFTGADRDRIGLFEQADGGTLFLDEVGDMSPAMQARLLRVLEDGEVRRVGGESSLHVDVRLLAATNRKLHERVEAGRFREDLLYRLQVLTIELPPLRERHGDIPLLVSHMLERIARERNRPAPSVESDALEVLERYPWPGNVRQLENTLQRLVLLAGDGAISRTLIDEEPALRKALLGGLADDEPVFSLEKSEREQIRRALESSGGNRNRAAKLLGISRATIYRKIKEYDLR